MRARNRVGVWRQRGVWLKEFLVASFRWVDLVAAGILGFILVWVGGVRAEDAPQLLAAAAFLGALHAHMVTIVSIDDGGERLVGRLRRRIFGTGHDLLRRPYVGGALVAAVLICTTAIIRGSGILDVLWMLLVPLVAIALANYRLCSERAPLREGRIVPDLVPVLVRQLGSDHESERDAALSELSRVHSQGAVRTLVDGCEASYGWPDRLRNLALEGFRAEAGDQRAPGWQRADAAVRLGCAGEKPDADALRIALHSAGERASHAASIAGRFRMEETRGSLATLAAQHPFTSTVDASLDALGAIGITIAEIGSVENALPDVRAARLLAGLEGQDVVEVLVRALPHLDVGHESRWVVADALASRGHGQTLVSNLRDSRDAAIRDALARMGPETIPLLRKAFDDTADADVCQALLEALADLGDVEVLAIVARDWGELRRAPGMAEFGVDYGEVISTALKLLVKLGDQRQDARKTVATLLGHRETARRRLAIHEITGTTDRWAVDTVITALDRELSESDPRSDRLTELVEALRHFAEQMNPLTHLEQLERVGERLEQLVEDSRWPRTDVRLFRELQRSFETARLPIEVRQRLDGQCPNQ
jgi:hypothetical protein